MNIYCVVKWSDVFSIWDDLTSNRVRCEYFTTDVISERGNYLLTLHLTFPALNTQMITWQDCPHFTGEIAGRNVVPSGRHRWCHHKEQSRCAQCAGEYLRCYSPLSLSLSWQSLSPSVRPSVSWPGLVWLQSSEKNRNLLSRIFLPNILYPVDLCFDQLYLFQLGRFGFLLNIFLQ